MFIRSGIVYGESRVRSGDDGDELSDSELDVRDERAKHQIQASDLYEFLPPQRFSARFGRFTTGVVSFSRNQEALPPVEVPAAAKWKFRSKPFEEVILDYDYTFTTPYCGSGTIEIDKDLLRGDGVLIRLRETRMHYVFGGSTNPDVLRESSWRESTFKALSAGIRIHNRQEYTMEQFKNKFSQLRGRWKDFTNLIKMETGLGYNSITGQIIASDDEWKKLCEKYKSAKQFKKKGCFYYDKLCIIFLRTQLPLVQISTLLAKILRQVMMTVKEKMILIRRNIAIKQKRKQTLVLTPKKGKQERAFK